MQNIDVSAATTIATAILGLLVPALIQPLKTLVPAAWRGLFALSISLVVAVAAIAITGGFKNTGWGMNIALVVAEAQVVYAIYARLTQGDTPSGTQDTPRV